jgi:outer membrane immunogenic protein
MKIKLLVAAAATVMAGSAVAQSAFEGAYGQLGVGFDQNSVSSSTLTASGNTGIAIPSSDAGSFSGIVGLGYNFPVAKDFLLGVGADYGFLPTSGTNAANANGIFQSKISNRYNVFVTPGYVLAKDKLAYLKAGYSSQTVKITNQSAVATGETIGSGSANGYVLGLGYKQMVASGFYGFGEANYYSYSGAQFSSQTLSDGSAISSYSPKTSAYQFLVGVGYKF